MKLEKLSKNYQGKYLAYYTAEYRNNDGGIKCYEFISRNNNLDMSSFGKGRSQGVGMVTLSLDKTKVLLQKEFRLACNAWVYNFPAGLIDEGENAEQAARRELEEETGLHIVEVIKVLPPSYTSQGTSDEMMNILICTCEGEIKESNHVDEEIIARWYTKEEIRELIDSGAFMSVRTQMFLYQWVNEK